MATKESTAVAVKESALPAMPAAEELKSVFEANFEGIVPAFAAIKIPSGGAPVWMVPTESEEPEAVKELHGVILDHYKCRAYWPEKFGGGNTPPECASLDGKTGYKYGKCADCKFSQWGSDEGGRGQSCKSMHRIFLLMTGSDSIFPMFISLPPTSAEGKYPGSLATYMVNLGGKLKKFHEVRTKVKLIKDKNKDGIEYSKAQFFADGDLNEDEKKQIAALREVLRPAMRSKPFEESEGPVDASKNGASSTMNADPWEK